MPAHTQSGIEPFAASIMAGGAQWRQQWRLKDVRWTLAYASFLAYIFVIVTYQVRLGDIAIAAALVGVLAQRGIRFPTFLSWLGALCVWGALGYTQTAHPEPVWEAIIVLGKIWLICLVALNVLRTFGQIRFFMIFFLCCFALYPARGTIFNYVLSGYTLVGRALWNFIYENPNDLAALTFLPLSIAAALFATDTSPWIKRGALASLMVLPALILITQSRGGILGLVCFGALALLGQSKRSRVPLAVVALAVAAMTLAPDGVWKRFGQTSVADTGIRSDDVALRMAADSARERWAILKVAGSVANDHLFFGVGLGGYQLTHASYAPRMGPKSAHNTYLEMAAETGLPGLLLFLGLLWATFYYAERARKQCKRDMPNTTLQLRYLESGLGAYLVAGLFGSFGQLSFLYIHLALIWALADAAFRHMRRAQSRQLETHAAP